MSTAPARLLKADRITRAGILIIVALGITPTLATGQGTLGALLMHVPLALFLLTLSPEHPRRYAWACFTVLAYFCAAVLEAFRWPSTEGVIGLINCAVITVMFITAMYASRWAEAWVHGRHAPDA